MGLGHPGPVEGVLSAARVEVAVHLCVLEALEDVGEGDGALVTVVVHGLAFLDQAVPVPGKPGEPGLAGSGQLLEQLGSATGMLSFEITVVPGLVGFRMSVFDSQL